MENIHVVRHIRYGEIDSIPELSWIDKQKLRARIRKKRIDFPLSLSKLKAGDEREWRVFVEMIQPRLRNYLSLLADERFIDDIVSESIINVFISRNMYNTVDHMIGSIHQFARYESFDRSRKRASKLLLSENIELFMDWDAYVNQHEQEDMEERKKQEEWKDKMLLLIRDSAKHLPAKWRAWIYVQLSNATPSENNKERLRLGMSTTGQQLCNRRLKFLIEEELYGEKIDRKVQLSLVKDLITHLNKTHLDIIKSIISCNSLQEAQDMLGLSRNVYRGRIELFLRKLTKVYQGPAIKNPYRLNSRFELIKCINDDEFWQAIKEGINDNGKVSRPAMQAVDAKVARDIVLMRDQQKMSWENIAIALHIDYKKIKLIYQAANPGIDIEHWSNGKHCKRRLLTAEQAAEIRRLYRTGNYTQPQLGAMFGVKRYAIQGIVEGRNYKETA